MGLLAIVALVSVIVISFTSADASGKPTTVNTDEDVTGITFGIVCGVDKTKADIHYEITKTTWPDKDMTRYVAIGTGELYGEDGVTIAELKSKETRQGHSGDGAIVIKMTTTAYCFDGGSEKLIHSINISLN